MVRNLRAASLLLCALSAVAFAQNPLETEAYLKPPPEIEKFVMAPRWENISLGSFSPDRTRFLVTRDDGMPSLASLGKPHYNLGGFQVDIAGNRARSMTINGRTGLQVFDLSTGALHDISIPKGAEIAGGTWSPDGKSIAFLALFPDRTDLFIADAISGKSRLLCKQSLLATNVTGVDWTGDGKHLVAVLIPSNRKAMPKAAEVASEPKIRLSDAAKHSFRTYPSLLETPTDMALVDYFSTGQLALIDAKSGGITPVGAPSLIESVNASPDGKYFRVTTMEKPYSYVVPVSMFGSKEEIWDASGKSLAELDKSPLTNAKTGGPTRTPGKRNLVWRPDGNGMSYIETEPMARGNKDGNDGGEDEQGRGQGRRTGGAVPADNRKDRVMQWLPPFGKDDAKVVWTAEGRISGVRYSADCKTLFVTDTKDGSNRTYAVMLDEPGKTYMLASVKSDETFDTPGTLVGKTGPLGEPAVTVSSDGAVYLQGSKSFKDPKVDAPRPFLDRVDIKAGTKTRLFESSPTMYETVSSLVDDDAKQLVISRQSPTMVPNSYLYDTASKQAKQLTNNRDITPELTALKRETIEVTRVDGFKFQVKVTMPANWTKGTKLPAMFWFYPSEFVDQAAYDRGLRGYNKNLFPNVGAQSMAILTQMGYAYIEPDVPITGPEGKMNDNYVPSLRNSLSAVIDKLDGEGYIDRTRLAIGGHSYGAFSTANALIHTPFFKAGIAGSGAYNRTLTPLGFQSENRQLWDDRELYETMSPLLYADQMNGALLMTHGMEDQNIGTNPINSERLFQSLNQLGKTCALYMYPYEDHGQVARETVLDKWARWVAWLEKYVKNAK